MVEIDALRGNQRSKRSARVGGGQGREAARGGGEARSGRRYRAARWVRRNTVLGSVIVSSVNRVRVRLCNERGRHVSTKGSRRTVLVVTSHGGRDVCVVALPRPARGLSRARASRERVRAVVACAKPVMTVHPAVLRKMDPEAGRAVVCNIPVAALVPAKMLVDQAVLIVGQHAVVRPRGFFP